MREVVNMAAWIQKVAQPTWNQNVYAIGVTVRCRNYCAQPKIIKNPTVASLRRGTGGRSSFNGMVCTVFGCSGFIATSLCIRLGKCGTQLILPHRCDPYHIRELKVGADLGQVLYHPFDLRDEESLIKCMKYSNVVINLIGSNFETSNFSFTDVHVTGARRLARLAKECNVERFIHVSCLNAAENPPPIMMSSGSKILKTKWEGEQAVREEFPEATIVRPSNIYGPGDNFLNHYLLRPRQIYMRSLPLWKRGEHTHKQPVNISDVVSGIVEIAKNPDTAGKTYQFFGPKRYTLRELIEWWYSIILKDGGHDKVRVIDFRYHPWAWLKAYFVEFLRTVHPTQDMTWDVLEFQHATDKIDPRLPTLEDLGIKPGTMEEEIWLGIMPYHRYRFIMSDLHLRVPISVKPAQK